MPASKPRGMEMAHLDDHDAILAEWERALDETTRERLRAPGYRLVSDAARTE